MGLLITAHTVVAMYREISYPLFADITLIRPTLVFIGSFNSMPTVDSCPEARGVETDTYLPVLVLLLWGPLLHRIRSFAMLGS